MQTTTLLSASLGAAILLAGILSTPDARANDERDGTAAVQWSVRSPSEQVLLLELYTSQGCSSCPPADRWLSRLRDNPQLFQEVVPVAFHVTYWNYLGWRDPLSRREHDTRQRQRAALAGSGVYTPGVFLQGREWRGWRRHPQGPTAPARTRVGVLHATGNTGTVTATFTPVADAQNVKLHFTHLRSGRDTAVHAGENRGETLIDDFIADRVLVRAMKQTADGWTVNFRTRTPTDAEGVALWVTTGDATPLQAAGGFFPAERS